MSEADRPKVMLVGQKFLDDLWQVFAEAGPRHAALARWEHRLGWTVSDEFARSWLAGERK